MKLFLSLLLLVAGAPAATIHVSTTGSDATGDGSVSSPYATITKAQTLVNAGDLVSIASGNYPEHIELTRGGFEGNLVRYAASGNVIVRAMRLVAPYISVEGITFRGASNTSWGAHANIASSANGFVIKSCHFGPGVYLKVNDFIYNDEEDSISTASGNFITAGFVPGQKIYLGAAGITGDQYPGGKAYHANHDTSHTIGSVTANKIMLSTQFAHAEDEQPRFAIVFAGNNHSGIGGIVMGISSSSTGSVSASNYRITENVFDGLWGPTADLRGSGGEFDHNRISNTHGYYGIRPQCSNALIHDNLWINCGHFVFYTDEEADTLTHPAGTGWYDYLVGFFHTLTGTNNRFYRNWVEAIESPLAQISEAPGQFGFEFSNNVFVGISGNLNGGRDQTSFLNNTWYKCAYRYPGNNPLVMGGNSGEAPMNGITILENVFADCGSRRRATEGGAYGLVNYINGTLDSNFVTSWETNGWAPRVRNPEPNGINGGDPVFRDPENPRGPDGLPFTDDDGLRPLPSSPLAAGGWGALPVVPVVVGQPFAHFRITSLSNGLGWKDPLGPDFNPEWDDVPPWDRTSSTRPYGTKEAIGFPPVTVGFSADKSVDGLTSGSTGPAGIIQYTWNFGDGSPVQVTSTPSVSHTFTSSGHKTVTLIVKNSLNSTAVYDNTYRVNGDTAPPPVVEGYHVELTGNDSTGTGSMAAPWRTIQKAVNSASPGANIIVGAGTFEGFDIDSINGTSGGRITITGQGAATVINSQISYHKSYWTVKNLKIMGETVQQAHVRFELNAHNCELTDFWMDNENRLYHPGIEFTTAGNAGGDLEGAFSEDQPQNCLVARGDITRVKGQVCVRLSGTNNIMEDCVVHDCTRVDFLRMWGENNIVRDCQFLRNNPAPVGETIGFHADFIQTFGTNGDGSRGHLFERLLVRDVAGQICQLVEGTATAPELIGTGAIGNWTFRNCIFMNISLGASVTIPGTKWYNNVFYLTGGIGTGNSTDRGSAVGWRIKNNVFLDVGELDRNNSGWYARPNPALPGYYDDWEADFNFVSKINYGKVRQTNGLPYEPYRWYEPHGINGGNPGFVDEAGGNFRLNASSPLIGMAVPLNDLFTKDFLEFTRGTGWDIGAIEYRPDYDEVEPPDNPPPPPPPPDNFPPEAPGELVVTALSFSRIDLSWADNSEGESGFHIFQSQDSGSGYALLATVAGNITEFSHMSLTPSTQYFYKVSSFNTYGESSQSEEVSATTLVAPNSKGNGSALMNR